MQTNKHDIGFNTACEQLRQKIIEDINLSDLPIAPVYFILQIIYYEVEKTYCGVLNNEAQQHPIVVNLDEEDTIENDSVKSEEIGQ